MIKNAEIIDTKDSHISKEPKVARVDQQAIGKESKDILLFFTFKTSNKIPLQGLYFSYEYKVLAKVYKCKLNFNSCYIIFQNSVTPDLQLPERD